MELATLGQALETEHRQIDGGIEAFIAALGTDDGADPAPLTAALSGLRRHIYLEEEFLFPPLKAAGLMGPIFVMLREHGMLWRQMDELEGAISSAANESVLRQSCMELLSLLSDHNSKEEPIIYTQADDILGTAASDELLEFLDRGTTPEGWVAGAA